MTERDRRVRIEGLQRDITHYDDRLDGLRRELSAGLSAIRPDFARQLDLLRGEVNRLVGRVEALYRASEGAWPSAWSHAEAALVRVRDGFARLEADLRDRAA